MREELPDSTPYCHADSLLASANESSRSARRSYVAAMLLFSYVALAVWSTTHEQLLRGAILALPLVNFGVSVWSFGLVAPWLLVLVHFNLLLHLVLLSRKVFAVERPGAIPASRAEPAFQHELFDDFVFTQALLTKVGRPEEQWGAWLGNILTSSQLRLTAWGTVRVLLPILLLFMQVRFLPYHDELVTSSQRAALIVDLAFVWVFYLSLASRPVGVPSGATASRWQGVRRRVASLMGLVIGLAVTASAVAIAYFVFTLPGETSRFDLWYTVTNRLPYSIRRLIPRDLELSGKTLVAEAPPPQVIAAFYERAEPAEDAWRRYAKGLDLRNRDLRFADLTRANLVNADLRGANLEGAILTEAHLAGARLTVAQYEQGGSFIIEDAKFSGVHLPHVKLPDADLPSATLRFGYLHEAEFPGADLRNANLLGAWTRFMDLRGADLRNARLQGVDSWGIDLRGADLRGAQLQGADLVFARLEGADLRGAKLQGADLRGAKLDGADLRGASVWNIHIPEASIRLADLRGVNDTPLPADERAQLVAAAKKEQDLMDWRVRFWAGDFINPLEARLQTRLQDAGRSIVVQNPNREFAMYDPGGVLGHWGEPPSEDDYRHHLTDFLVELSCQDTYIMRAVLGERKRFGESGDSEFLPRGTGVIGQLNQRAADLFAALPAKDCPSLKRLPVDLVERLTHLTGVQQRRKTGDRRAPAGTRKGP